MELSIRRKSGHLAWRPFKNDNGDKTWLSPPPPQKNKPAPDNLEVPPHMYLSDTSILIGEDKKA